MSLNIDGDDVITIAANTPSPNDPIQDNKIIILEGKTQNINSAATDGTKTEFNNKVVAAEMETPLSTAVEFRSSQYFDNIGNSGFFMGSGASGAIQINKTTYQGTNGAIMKLSTNGTIEKSGVTIDALNNVQTLGYVQAPIISATTELSTEKITNFDSPTPTTAITIAPTTANLTFASALYANGTANKMAHIGAAGELLVSTATLTAAGNIECKQVTSEKIIGGGGGPNNDLELLNSNNVGIQIKSTTAGLINFSQDEYNLTGNKGKLLKLSTGNGQDVGDVTVSTIQDDASGNVKFNGTPYIGLSNVMVRLNTDGTVERTNINIDGAGVNNISNCNTMSALSVASSNILNSSNLFSPNMFLGLQGGGPASAGNMDINSGNIINTGDITPITDNTEDIGTLALAYKDIHIKGDVYKNGVVYSGGGGGGGGGGGVFITEMVLLKEVGTVVASATATVQTRNINTLINPGNYSWCTLSAPTFTLSVGTYAIRARGTAYAVAHTQAYIYNVTDGVYENVDQPIVYNTNVDILIDVTCETIINVQGSAKQYQFRQWTETANAIGLSGNKSGANLTNNPSGINNSLAEVSIIKTVPSLQITNAEYDAIVVKWLQERPSVDLTLVKIYLPQGVSPGTFNHTIHPVYIFTQNLVFSSRQPAEVRFKGYLENGVPRTTTYFVGVSNIANSIEIYNSTSQAHPNNIANPNEKQHIINHFLSDYNYEHFGQFQVTNIVRIAILAGDVGNWDKTKPFFVSFDISPFVSPQQSGIVTLFGSQNGWTVSNGAANYGTIPSGYTEIF
jgi:hypothetical protein